MNNRQACSDCSLRGQPMSEYTGSAHPDILFVGEYPILQHAGNSVPVAKEKLVTRIINNEQTEHIRYGHICAVRCVPDKAVCNRKNIDICAQQLKDFIYQSKPRVIVALGTIAVKGLGIRYCLHELS